MSDQETNAAVESPAAPADGEHVVTEDQVREALRSVVDPEIGLDMVSLGLLYGVNVEGSKVRVTMTLTTPACPVGPMFVNAVHQAVMAIPGVSECDVDCEVEMSLANGYEPDDVPYLIYEVAAKFVVNESVKVVSVTVARKFRISVPPVA